MSVNIKNILHILEQKYDQLQPSVPTEKEKAIVNNIIEILEGYRSNLVKNDEFLDYDEAAAEQHVEDIDEINETDDDEWVIDSSTTDAKNSNDPSIEQKKRAVEFADTPAKSGKKPKLSSISRKFRFVKSHEQLNRWRKQILSGGSKWELQRQINEHVIEKFEFARSNHSLVHDSDLKRWALEKGSELNLRAFKASSSWLLQFKRKNKIVSRKITKVLSRRHIVQSPTEES